ncbi:MAG: PEP-CTERM sorting domain-containing protein [Pyrinomonadaceae bacterium]
MRSKRSPQRFLLTLCLPLLFLCLSSISAQADSIGFSGTGVSLNFFAYGNTPVDIQVSYRCTLVSPTIGCNDLISQLTVRDEFSNRVLNLRIDGGPGGPLSFIAPRDGIYRLTISTTLGGVPVSHFFYTGTVNTVVPEPASILLLCSGLAGVAAGVARRRRAPIL